jgi:predicted nucleic acid-binding protein
VGHYYLDSSALVKRYVAETGTGWVIDLCASDAGHTVYTVRISGAEIVLCITVALAQKVASFRENIL